MSTLVENRRNALLAIVATLVALVAFNTVLAYRLPRARLDLTQDGLYSLSPGTRGLLEKLDPAEKVRVDFYWTRSTSAELPQINAHAQRVKEFLEDLQQISGGRIVVATIDPEPFSEAEDQARAAGVPALSVDGSGRTLTLGLVVRGPTDKKEVIQYLSPDREPFLEYETMRAIASVGRAAKPTVGILSGMELEGGFDPMQPQAPPRGAPTSIEQMRALFDVKMVSDKAETLPEGLTALLVIQPRRLTDGMLHAIDAWALAGKPLIVLADPYAETDTDPDSRRMGAKRGGTTYDLGPLLAAWGVQIAPDMVVGDRLHATRIQANAPGGGVRALDYAAWLSLPKERFAKADPIVGSLSQINLMSAGAVVQVPGSTSTVLPLIQSSPESQLIQTLKLGFFGDPEQLIKDFKSDDQAKTLAARITGPIRSAFDPAAQGTANIVLVADADLVSDGTWVVDERVGGVSMGKHAIADNGPFLVNAVELMSGDPALAQVRARGSYRRPFTVVDSLRKAAEGASVARERDLQDEIRKTELRIGEIQRERSADGSQTLVLTPQQLESLKQLETRMTEARGELRKLQLGLRHDVEALGLRLLLLNTVAWPLAVAAAALAWYLLRYATSHRSTTA